MDKFAYLLKEENEVVVQGKISLFPQVSEYQILIHDVQPVRTDRNNNLFTVSDITSKLEQKLAESSHELTKIHIRGEISESAQQAGTTFWFLKDIGKVISTAIGDQQIHCVRFDGSLIQDEIPVNNGNQIRIEGNIQIWPPQSRYQIKVTDIKPDDRTGHCLYPGCDRLREAANFESCATCLPRPPDELYELCPECYAISPDHETKVADAVYAYFHELQVNGFSPYIHIRNASSECKECQIQFGARNGIADVVLADGNGSFAAIAECKGAGYVGHGIEQLKSYLSATDTRFGIFANRADSNQWKFYENRRGNCISEIDCSEFETGVVEGIATRERLKDEIGCLNGKIIELENQISELDTTVDQITQTKCNLTEHTSNLKREIGELENYKSELHEEIRRKLEKLFEEKMQRLEKPLSDLKIELQKRGIVNWFKNLFSKEYK